MEKNENGGCLPDIDLADFNHLVSLDDRGAAAFDGFMRNLAEKLTASLPDEENPLKKYRIGFYLQDRQDKSPARISSSEYRSDPADLSGRDFVVMFNREKLAAIESEDELAFILGHELSHLSWQHGNDRVRALSSNEEAACDLNAMKLLFDAGYDATVVSTMDREVPPTEEWRLRKDARRQAMNAFFDFRRPQPLDQTPWRGSRYEKWRPDFKVPSAETPEDEAVAMMVGNLQKVYVRGGADDFQQLLKDCVSARGSEAGSRFFLRLAAAAAEKFPPIDKEGKSGTGYRSRFRHPISVLGNALPAVAAMPGKKLFPPEACAKINAYFKQNPDYYRTMKVFWDKMLPEGGALGANVFGRGGR